MIQVKIDNKKDIKVYVDKLYDFKSIPKEKLELIIYTLEERLRKIKSEE